MTKSNNRRQRDAKATLSDVEQARNVGLHNLLVRVCDKYHLSSDDVEVVHRYETQAGAPARPWARAVIALHQDIAPHIPFHKRTMTFTVWCKGTHIVRSGTHKGTWSSTWALQNNVPARIEAFLDIPITHKVR